MVTSIRKQIISRYDTAINGVVRTCNTLQEIVTLADGHAVTPETKHGMIIAALVSMGEAIEKAKEEFMLE